MFEPKAIRYSARGGVIIDYRTPDEVVIRGPELVCLLLCLQSFLTQEEMSQQFSREEQQTIHKYYDAVDKKQMALFNSYCKKRSVSAIKRAFKNELALYTFHFDHGLRDVMTQLWGWELSSNDALPLIDRLILGMLDHPLSKNPQRLSKHLAGYFTDPKLGKPSADTIAKVEAVTGPLDWKAIQKAGRDKAKRQANPTH